MIKRIATLLVGSLVMVACGPGAKIDGRQGAAQALFAASQPGKAKADTSSTPAGGLGGISWNCPEGGSADISGASVNVGSGGVSAGVTLTYNSCGLAKADVGVAVFNGDLTLSQKAQVGGDAASLEQSFKGKVLVQGAFDDFLDADVTQTITASALGSRSGTVSMTLVGTITTSEDTYTFNEAIDVTAGSIAAKVKTSK